MKKFIIEMITEDDFKVGECSKCRFRRGRDQCDLQDFLTNGTCKLNCFCPLIDKNISTL